jgi:hypothetical protein
MHAGSLQPHETVLSRLTGVQSKRIEDQLEIEVMITATLPVSLSSCPYRNRKAHCLARHDFLERLIFEQCVDYTLRVQLPFLRFATNDGTLSVQLIGARLSADALSLRRRPCSAEAKPRLREGERRGGWRTTRGFEPSVKRNAREV